MCMRGCEGWWRAKCQFKPSHKSPCQIFLQLTVFPQIHLIFISKGICAPREFLHISCFESYLLKLHRLSPSLPPHTSLPTLMHHIKHLQPFLPLIFPPPLVILKILAISYITLSLGHLQGPSVSV